MGRKRKQYKSRKQQKYIGESVSRIKQELKSSRERSMKDKYKAILGLKEPVVVLKKLPESLLKAYRIISTYLKNDIKEEYKEKKTECSTHQVVCNSPTLDKLIGKRGRPKKIVPKEEEVCVNSTESKFGLWEIKHDANLKDEALRKGKKLIVTLRRTKQYDQGLNVMEFPQIKEEHNDSTTNKVKIKQKRNTLKEPHINKTEVFNESSFIDLDNFSHCAVDFSQDIFSSNYILNKYMSDIQIPNTFDDVVEDTNVCCIHTEEGDLTLRKVEEDMENSVCENLDINARKIKKLPIIIKETTLAKHSIKLVSNETEVSRPSKEDAELCNNDVISNRIDLQDSDSSRVVPKNSNITHTNERIEIVNKQSFNLKRKFVIPKIRDKNTHIDNDTTCKKTINVINNVDYHSEYSGELDKENNQNTWFPSQSSLPQNCISYTVVNNVNNLHKEHPSLEKSTDSVVVKNIPKSPANNASRYLSDNTDVSKQKRLNTDQGNNSQLQKKPKLDNSNLFKDSATADEANRNVVNSANASSLFELNDKELMPEMTILSSSNNVQLNSADVITDVDESKSETDKGIKDFQKQNRIEGVEDTDAPGCNSLQNTRDSKEAASNVHESSTKSPHSTSVDDYDWDYISLDTHSSIIDEYCDPTCSSRREKKYLMTDTTFDNYYKINKSEFNEMYENNNINNSTERISKETNLIPRPRPTNTKKLVIGNDLLREVFKGHCYRMVQYGNCTTSVCRFKHNFMISMELLFHHEEQIFFLVLDELVLNDHIRFIEKLFTDMSIHCAANDAYLLNTLKRLYDLASITDQIIIDINQWLQANKSSLRIITNHLVTIVNNYDSKFINWFLSGLKSFTELGAYWDTCRSLVLKTKYLDPQIIQIILQECIVTKRHLQDISVNVIPKIDATVYCKINEQLLLTFNNLVKSEKSKAVVKPNVLSEPIKTILSPDENSETLHQQDICSKTDKDGNNNNNTNENTKSERASLTLHPIDGLTKPYSTVGRIIHWSYQAVQDIQEGLTNYDYDRVMEILNSVPTDQTPLFVDACYKILCKEIIRSHCHLSKLIACTVRTGATKVLYQILLEIAICILAQLAEENYWVLAYTLLKDVYVMLRNQINLHQLDAATIFLFVEIYLANQQPLKALTLLKQSNVILTSPSNWKVQSTKQDNYTRVQVITFLLDELCTAFPEHAFFLFRILITDQYSNFHPIDLAHFANKMVLVVIQQESHEMITDVGRLIDDYCITLNTVTFRALIAALVNVDMQLAKQLYQKAMNLGIYSRPQFYPVTYLIVNSDWTSEEMFLAITNLMKLLLLNVGHAIEYVSPRNLIVYLIFESIPSESELRRDTASNEYNQQIKASQTLMKDVLARKFDPPLLFTKAARQKVCRLSNKSILAYLQTEHYE